MRCPAWRGCFLLAVLASSFAVAGCSGGKSSPAAPVPDPAPAAGVVVSRANPVTGDGTLTGLTVAVSDLAITPPSRRVRILGTANGKKHRVDVVFVLGTSAVSNVTHVWGNSVDPGAILDARNACTTCDPAKVKVDQTTKTVTLKSLVLVDDGVTPGNTSTLLGTNAYP